MPLNMLLPVHMVVNHAILAKYHPGPNPVYVMAGAADPNMIISGYVFSSKDEAEALLSALKG